MISGRSKRKKWKGSWLLLLLLVAALSGLVACGGGEEDADNVVERPDQIFEQDPVVEETEPGTFTNSDPAVENEVPYDPDEPLFGGDGAADADANEQAADEDDGGLFDWGQDEEAPDYAAQTEAEQQGQEEDDSLLDDQNTVIGDNDIAEGESIWPGDPGIEAQALSSPAGVRASELTGGSGADWVGDWLGQPG